MLTFDFDFDFGQRPGAGRYIRDASTVVPVPALEVNKVGETLGRFIEWPTHLIKTI